jgi:hypothetical protein
MISPSMALLRERTPSGRSGRGAVEEGLWCGMRGQEAFGGWNTSSEDGLLDRSGQRLNSSGQSGPLRRDFTGARDDVPDPATLTIQARCRAVRARNPLLTQTVIVLSRSIKRSASEGLESTRRLWTDGMPGDVNLPTMKVVRRGAPSGKQQQFASLGAHGWRC